MLPHRTKQVDALSGGQRKRVSIAAELLADPSLFFLDEPTSGLDPGLEKKMMHTLRQLADGGRTVVLVTHATENIALCGDVQIEDLWRPFLCVSSNLTHAEPLVHATGSLWHALRASTAIPGMFAPVLHDGAVLVDGAVLNNFPLDLVRERCEDGLVIGSNVSPLEDRARHYQFGAAVSGWDVLFRAINPFARQIEAPLLFETLLRSIEVNIAQRLKSPAFRQLADMLIEPQVSRFGMLDFDAYAEMIDIGYQEALAHLPAIQAVLRARAAAPARE
jgi:predicted acylesterase/phospholipase RssA